ncbi:ATP-binding cassette domain-containing protein [Eubacterium multiforme]|uniref:ABC transport system ATP-binding protein n=1 Tax=Eubacterium multiforme TaxID=83339 RepID=A0ABT9UYC6_9FIRM|nr:ATP-binding cassette domain-containing protein [Eubacterium multiforme]MDQ0151311.1 putative ABC transport system ATP-binding protein [Eubacterium multiforme]
MNILSIKNIYYRADNTDILKGISIDVKEGDCISIIGSSGSGKSTLLKICSDLITPSCGDIYYREKNYKDYNPLDLRRKISYCIQTPYLFGETVFENIIFPFKIRNEEIDKSEVMRLFKKFNLDESFLDKEIKSLSGGEKQRIALVRNLIYTPDILLLDEVTSALDKENCKLVEAYIKELNDKGVTIVWVTHSMEQSESIFNKRIVISEGKVEKMEELR